MWSLEIEDLAQGNSTDKQKKRTWKMKATWLKLLHRDQILQRRANIWSSRQITTLSLKWWKSPLKETKSCQTPPHRKIKPTWRLFWAKRALEVDKRNQKTFNTMQSEIVFLKNLMKVQRELVRRPWKLNQCAFKWMKHSQRQNECSRHT